MQHRLMIVGSSIEFVDLVRLAKKRGYQTIVCDGNPDGPAKKEADQACDINVRDVDAIARVCREEQVDGIIGSFSDLLFEQITKIADKAGLKWYAVPDKLPYYREKDQAKELLRSIGVRVPRSKTLTVDFKDCELEDLTFPLVIKPINGYGSKGIYVVRSIGEIREKFAAVLEHAPMKGKIQAEEYSAGLEYNMMTWMADGEIYVLSIGDRVKNPQIGDTVPLLNRVVYPAHNIEEVIEEAKDVLRKFAMQIGQTDGALSMQFFYNDNGVEVCEIAGRLFGYEHELLTLCSGFNVEELLLDYVYDEVALKKNLQKHSPFFNVCCTGIYLYGKQGKVIRDLSALRSIAEDPHVVEHVLFYKEGETIDNCGPKPYLVRYYVKTNNQAEMNRILSDLFSKMRAEADDGSELVQIPVLV